MAGVNIGNVGLTFTRYLSGVVETLNQTSKARSMTRNDDKWTGDHIEFVVHVGRNGGIGNTQDGGQFPVAGKQSYVNAKAYRKFTVGSIQLTDGVMATASGNANVARDVVTSEVKGLMDGILKYENGMFFKDGTGQVAEVKDTISTVYVTVDDARMMWEGATYDFWNGTSASRGTSTVVSVRSAPTTAGYAYVTLDATVSGVVANDNVYWNGAKDIAITGLGKLIDDTSTTFQNVNTTTYPRYKSLVLSNSSVNRALTPSLFRQMLAGIKQKSGNDNPSSGLTVLTNNWQAINVEELYEGDLRLTPDTTVAGIAVASFQSALGKIDILVDSDAPYNKMFFVDFSKIYRGVQKPLDWRRERGEIFKRSDVSGVWTATAMEIAELYIKERHTSGRIDDLLESPSTMY